MITNIKVDILLIAVFLLGINCLYSQNKIDIFVYHGTNNTTLWDYGKNQFLSDIPIIKAKGQTVNIRIVNPNPLFYSYEFKQNDVEIKEDFPDISSLLAVVRSTMAGSEALFNDGTDYDVYLRTLTQLEAEVEKAKVYLKESDKPETLEEAVSGGTTGGLKLAIVKIDEELSNEPGHFNSATLADDLKNALEAIPDSTGMDVTTIKAFKALNIYYIQEVNEIKALISPNGLQSVITSTFNVTEKETKIVLTIKAKDSNNQNLQRDVKEITIATVQPLFERAAVELIPVAIVRFTKDISEFYTENGIVRQRIHDDVSFLPGVIFNVNVASFGETKEMAVGIGLGYSISTKQNQFNQFSLSSLLSYKNFLRMGFGFGYSSYPSGLRDGGKVDDILPANVKDLNDIIDYESKAGFFISFSFTGLKLK